MTDCDHVNATKVWCEKCGTYVHVDDLGNPSPTARMAEALERLVEILEDAVDRAQG